MNSAQGERLDTTVNSAPSHFFIEGYFQVNDTNFNEANRLFIRPEVQTYQSEQQALRVNYEKLKAARLTREAQATPA
jgi:hypothetical protein